MPWPTFSSVVALLLLLATAGPACHAQGAIRYEDWQLEWGEEFNRPSDTLALLERWRFAYPWGRNLLANPETEYYSGVGVRPDSGGVLHLVARRLAQPIRYQGKELRYSSGMLMSHHPVDSLRPAACPPDANGFSYGLFEVRCRQPANGSVFPAFWLWGGGPDEIDVFEASRWGFGNTIHTNTPGYWYPTRTRPDACSCFFYDTDPHGDLHEQFHTYSVRWMPNEVTFYFDNVPIRRETRLLPNGCAMFVIVNLAMWNWANSEADTLAIDYVRVYRPRVVPPPVAVVRRGGAEPSSELNWIPLDLKPGRLDPGRRQRWQAGADAPGRLALRLTDNLNAECDITLPLPLNGRWAPPWLVLDNLPDMQVGFAAADSVHWQLANPLGQVVAAGTAAGPEWQPRWPDVAPGPYVLHLRQNQARVAHPVVFLARSFRDAAPLPAWLKPVPLAPTDSLPGPVPDSAP